MKILVTGANGDIAEAIGKIIKSQFSDFKLEGSDANGEDYPAAFFFSKVHSLLQAKNNKYLTELCSLHKKNKYDLIIPVTEPEIVKICSEINDSAQGISFAINAKEVVLPFSDKLGTYEWLKEREIPCAHTILASQFNELSSSIVLKPRIGWGGKDVVVVKSDDSVSNYENILNNDFVAQEYLDLVGGEFTCAITKFKGVSNILQLRREIVGGLTKFAEITNDEKINNLLNKLANCLPNFAFINVQLRMDASGPKIFEINPRLSGTTAMRHELGYTDLVWLLRYFLWNESLPAFIPSVGKRVYRLSSERIA